MKQWTHSITFKIIFICIILIIPTNIITTVISRYAVDRMREEVYLTKKNEMELQMNRIDQELAAMEQRMQERLRDNYTRLASYEKEPAVPMLTWDLWSKLRELRQQTELMGAAFFITNWDDHLYMTYNNAGYTYDDACILENYLKGREFVPYESVSYEPVDIGGHLWYLHTGQYVNFTIGYLIDSDVLLSAVMAMELTANEQVSLMDSEGRLPSGVVLDLSKSVQKLPDHGRTEKYYIIPYVSEILDAGVVRQIPVTDVGDKLFNGETLLLILAVLCFLAVPLLIFAVHRIVLAPMRQIVTAMEALRAEQMDYRIGDIGDTTEFKLMAGTFNQMTEEISNLKIAAYEKDIEKLEIEKMNLRLQLNPHLLLNSLNIIYSLAQAGKNKVITKYVVHLVEYFRYSIRKNDELVSVTSEIEFVKNYLEIQAIRFPERFTFVYDIEDGAFFAMIPALLIENFVENSIKYGMKMGEKMEIIVRITCREEKLQISVCDTGNGMNPETLRLLRGGQIIEDEIGRHIGLWNCRQRLRLYYGAAATLNITSAPGEGTQVWLEVPAVFKEAEI